jgi:hypothetical protein
MTMSAHPALVLNADFRPMSYFPLSRLCWEDAVHAVFSERVSVVAAYATWARSPSTKIWLPSVVALRKYQPTARRVAFTRFNVSLRDRLTCQYCAEVFPSSALTSSTSFRGRAVARPPGRTSSRPACPATRARATRCASSRGARRGSRRRASCWLPSAHSHPTICTKAGWTISTGMWSWKPNTVS